MTSLKEVQKRKALEDAMPTDSYTDLSEVFTDYDPGLDSPPPTSPAPEEREQQRARATSTLWENANQEGGSKPPAADSHSAELLQKESDAVRRAAEEVKRECELVLAEAKHAAETDSELQKARLFALMHALCVCVFITGLFGSSSIMCV